MTRKHYTAVAGVLAEARDILTDPEAGLAAWEHIVNGLAGVFAADNSAFDRTRFVKAAGR